MHGMFSWAVGIDLRKHQGIVFLSITEQLCCHQLYCLWNCIDWFQNNEYNVLVFWTQSCVLGIYLIYSMVSLHDCITAARDVV